MQAAWASHPPATTGMVLVPAGSYLPFYAPKESKRSLAPLPNGAPPAVPVVEKDSKRAPVLVAAFWMDKYPVSNQQYLDFVRANPQWRKSRVKSIFSDGHYLERWQSDLKLPNSKVVRSPVTQVSWFAAQAYCEWKHKTLPTVDQWEYAAADGNKAAQQRILEWYSHPSPTNLPSVGSTKKNGLGIYDLHGLIWEWTFDFNSGIQGQEAREDGTEDNNLFCGNGSQGALDATDYASFMRYGFRNSLKANYTVANLGFRCAKEVDGHE